MTKRFPAIDNSREPSNPAIQLYGRRFYKDQTPVDYLAELLMVFASPKGEKKTARFSFSIEPTEEGAKYWPDDRIALKFFSFFPTSKLDSRHPQHQKFYLDAIASVKSRVGASEADKDETIRILQALFMGFAGVAKTRTWVTYTFLPISSALLAREVTWNNPAALKNRRRKDTSTWDGLAAYFDKSTHNFLGRGGELLFLQLASLFYPDAIRKTSDVLSDADYAHVHETTILALQKSIEEGLSRLLLSSGGPIGTLADFIEKSLGSVLDSDEDPVATRLGWVPRATRQEALLFAFEISNISGSSLTLLEKADLLRTLCVMQVLRSLCFQGARVDGTRTAARGFAGDYVWICSPPDAAPDNALKKLSQRSIACIEELLFRALRSPDAYGPDGPPSADDLKNGDANCFGHFRKFGKEIGLIIPRTGKGQRFVLPPHLLRFLVAALLRPGERIRLNRFFERVFAHYGIALGGQQLAAALAWEGVEGQDFAVAADTQWIEETLRQGGLLVELSDAVSMVRNPAGSSNVT
ncbi:MAG: hypothetical protein K9L88_01190 [Chromatiaceae bacterium]|nr:hypothetical protein [Chromatiaceae bacterium]